MRGDQQRKREEFCSIASFPIVLRPLWPRASPKNHIGRDGDFTPSCELFWLIWRHSVRFTLQMMVRAKPQLKPCEDFYADSFFQLTPASKLRDMRLSYAHVMQFPMVVGYRGVGVRGQGSGS